MLLNSQNRHGNLMQNKRLIFILIAMACNLISCITFSKDESDHPPMSQASEYLPPHEVMGLYKNSIETIFTSAAAVTSGRTLDAQPVLAFKTLFDSMIWAQIGNDHIVIALNSGNLGKSIFAILTPDNEELKIPGATLHASHNPKYNSVIIRPSPMSSKWAGVFLMHELSHVRELNKGQNFSRGKTEFHAYRVEMQALNIVTDGKYFEALDAALSQLAIGSVEEFVAFIKNKTDARKTSILSELEEKIAAFTDWPASPQEREMRHGLNTVALVLRFYENKGLLRTRPAVQIHKIIDDVLTAVSVY